MFEFLMTAAQDPLTPRIVLAGVTVVFVIEAWKSSASALLGDMFAEGMDD
ncbi:MAG: hypothetical protein AAGF33_10720 [Pseudomonadota bacterium]